MIQENIQRIRSELHAELRRQGRKENEIQLLAATKTQSPDLIAQAIAAGVDGVGENRVQEMQRKWEAYQNIPLHFFGRLQKNKIKDVVGKVCLIHSVEDLEQANLISRRATQLEITQDILLEINIGSEVTKGGFLPDQALTSCQIVDRLPGLNLRGLMCIPPATDESEKYFEKMSKIFVDITRIMPDNRTCLSQENFSILSMGMSDDYLMAASHGSTMVRIGTAIFGQRSPLT
jgi:pyridoxal phosphate enzyme (YggS family)